MKKYDTPLIDEHEKGPWPSFVTEMKKAAKNNEMANDAVGHLEKCFRTKVGYWKHGGIVGEIDVIFDILIEFVEFVQFIEFLGLKY